MTHPLASFRYQEGPKEHQLDTWGMASLDADVDRGVAEKALGGYMRMEEMAVQMGIKDTNLNQ